MDSKDLNALTSLDDVLKGIGQCGLFQILLVMAIHSTVIASVGGMMMMAFGSYSPGWECLDGLKTMEKLSVATNGTIQLVSTSTLSDSSQSGFENSTDLCLTFSTCQNVSFYPGSSTIATEWGLVCDRAWALKIILIVQMIGVLVGAYMVGHMGDCMGSNRALYVMVAINAVFNLIAVFSPSWQVFAAVRFFIGIGSGAILTPAFVTPMEFAGQLWRSVIACLPVWAVSTSILSLFVVLLKDWRQLHLLYAGISALVLLPAFWVPESFRWLAVNGRDKQASNVANGIAKINRRPQPSLEVLVSMAENERQRARAERTGRYGYLGLFRIAFIRKQTLVMGFTWLSMSIAFFGISFNVRALSGNFYTNFIILSVMEIPSTFLSMPTNSFLPRRFCSCLYLSIVAVACFGIAIVSLASKDDTFKASFVLGLAAVAKMSILCSWNSVNVFCVELFPTVVRTMAYGYLNVLTRVGSLVGPVLFPQDPDLLYLAMIVMGTLMATSAGLIVFLPETRGAPLEDMFRSKNCFNEDHDFGNETFIKSQEENIENEKDNFEVHSN